MPLKLSEAIRLGAMLKPRVRGDFFGEVLVTGWRGWLLRRTEVGTCALGAALDARGERHRGKDGFHAIGRLWPWTDGYLHAGVVHPVTGESSFVVSTIYNLNDTHRWTREQIADWVEQVENAHAVERPAAVRSEAL